MAHHAAAAVVYVLIIMTFGAFLPLYSVSAAELGPGCRTATAEDHARMEARGLPKGFQVCPADEKILGIGQNFESWYAQLKTQSPCNKNSCTLSCKTRNTGAQVCGPTASRWGSLGCHPNNRTAIFPTVSHGFAAHIELLRRYCSERGRCTIDRVVQQWTAVAGDRAAYANFVSKQSGMPINKVFDPNDIDVVGRIALSMACFEAGSLPYNADELKKGLVMAGGGPRVATPSNVGDLLNESLSGSFSANPANSPNSHPTSWAYAPFTGSPYNVNPYSGQGASSGIGATSGTGAAPVGSLLNGQSPLGVSTGTGSGGDSNSDGKTGLSASTIVVQPKNARTGSVVMVSWTSVNMKPSSCKVTKNGTEFATGNEATKRDTVESSVEYALECTTPGGETAVSKATVTI